MPRAQESFIAHDVQKRLMMCSWSRVDGSFSDSQRCMASHGMIEQDVRACRAAKGSCWEAPQHTFALTPVVETPLLC
jgi:hypothetical protein